MLRNYLKTALRNLLKNKIFSFINIFGLAIGMTCSMLIWLWVEDERAMDAFHANDDYLYAIVQRQYHDGVVDAGHFSPGVLPEELKIVFPEVQHATGGAWDEEHTFEG